MIQSIFRNIATAEERIHSSLDPVIPVIGPPGGDPLSNRYLSRAAGAMAGENAFISNA